MDCFPHHNHDHDHDHDQNQHQHQHHDHDHEYEEDPADLSDNATEYFTDSHRFTPRGTGTSYGTMSAIDDSQTSSIDPAHSNTSAHHRRTRSSSTRNPSHERSSRKPPTLRRMSSKPYRGQEFSVHDDPSEFIHDHVRKASSQNLRSAAPNLRKRPTVQQQPPLVEVDSGEDSQIDSVPPHPVRDPLSSDDSEEGVYDDDRSILSTAESFTLKDRQQAINQTHPFGIRIWKPAVYKKFRSIERSTEGDIHSAPGERVSPWLLLTNILWTIIFGWWLALIAAVGALTCRLVVFSPSAASYARVFLGLSGYLFYPFGSYVLLESDENYAEEDEGEGRSISEYERWQNGDLEHGRLFFGPIDVSGRRSSLGSAASEHDSLLHQSGGRTGLDDEQTTRKRRFFGRGKWSLARVVFYAYFYCLVGPPLFLVSLICWISVFGIPMGRVSLILFRHLRRHPLALTFHSDSKDTRASNRPSSILLCTYRAAGLKYWKYTIDGTNIFFINLMSVVLLTILNYFILHEGLGLRTGIANLGLIFVMGLLSVIPLAYFIGQAVASISAQSSMGLGAAVNAFFSTVVEVYLYCVALTEGKSRLVEGSIIGSILAGILFLPGISMCFGALVRKTQRFNDKSAGVTSTMLLFAMIAAFGPTIFYQVYGSYHSTSSIVSPAPKPIPQSEIVAGATSPKNLPTHAAMIWATEIEEKRPALHTEMPAQQDYTLPPLSPHNRQKDSNGTTLVRDTTLFNRILSQSLENFGLVREDARNQGVVAYSENTDHHLTATPSASGSKSAAAKPLITCLPNLSKEDNEALLRHMTEVAATAAVIAARDPKSAKKSFTHSASATKAAEQKGNQPVSNDEVGAIAAQTNPPSGGHDAPNWSKTKSSIILLGATVLYAVIAEILVKTVDVVLESVDIEEKFLGITLFALVPNTTEFLNAISFAMNGNIALSMEIGSAYALQVCLLQIPALIFFSGIYGQYLAIDEFLSHTFKLWDTVTIILCVFLLSYMYGEGKSNYFKGSILVLTYIFVIMGFYLSGFSSLDQSQIDTPDTLALSSATFRTVGRANFGRAL
ncbi:hypothetical protein KEM54_006686 [Ascosphaera aggregata]|nr:hypothetical protein KEM54_006686 [Ascosphaera aggregata]